MRTWELILMVIGIVLVTTIVYAAQFTTTTGTGYYTWNGQVISYYRFNPDSTFNEVNGVTATDTNGTNPAINQQAFGNYVCTQNGNC